MKNLWPPKKTAQTGNSGDTATERRGHWHLIPDELFEDIDDILTTAALSVGSNHPPQEEARRDLDVMLMYLNSTDADGIVGEALRGLMTLSEWDQGRGLSNLLRNLPRMDNQAEATKALLKTWALTLYWCKNTPGVNDSTKSSQLHTFAFTMEKLQESRDPDFQSPAYKRNAKKLQRIFYNKAIPNDLYSTLTCVLPGSGIPGSLLHLGETLGLENDNKCQEAKAAWLIGTLEKPTGLHSYIDGDYARSQVARRVVDWRFTHVEGKPLSSVLDISGCGVDRIPSIARLRDLPAIDASRSACGALRKAQLTEVNASGNCFPQEELKQLRNLGLVVHLGNNTPAIKQSALNSLNRWQGKNKTRFTLDVPERPQGNQDQQPAIPTTHSLAEDPRSLEEWESLPRVGGRKSSRQDASPENPKSKAAERGSGSRTSSHASRQEFLASASNATPSQPDNQTKARS